MEFTQAACCDIGELPVWLKPLLGNIHPEVLSRYYGCGLVCPPLLEGCRVLDLGCGSGRDVYALAQLVGATGSVTGVDMTDEQLAVARRHQAVHAAQFGYDNVRFVQGYIERLDQLGLEPESFDVIVSNCVVNLSPDKPAVLVGVRTLLRLFRIEGLEDACEDHGQAVIYRGTIARHADHFELDKRHDFPTGRVFPVCGNTYRMLRETRFAPHFEFIGDFSRHFGLFAGCGGELPFTTGRAMDSPGSCC